MRNRFLLVLVVLLMFPFALHAAENDYWQGLKERLAKISPTKKGSATTAVGGVRGSKDQSADTLYWKDETIDVQVPDEEYLRFSAAYQSAAAGEKESALSRFQLFVNDYPQSALKEEALAAINTLQRP